MNKLTVRYILAIIFSFIGFMFGLYIAKHSLHPVDAVSLGAIMAIFILIIVVILETRDDE